MIDWIRFPIREILSLKHFRSIFYHDFESLLWVREQKAANKVKKVHFDNFFKKTQKSDSGSYYGQEYWLYLISMRCICFQQFHSFSKLRASQKSVIETRQACSLISPSISTGTIALIYFKTS